MTSTPSAATRAATSRDWAWASDLIRRYSRSASAVARGRVPPSVPGNWMPRSGAPFRTVTVLDTSIRALDGTQSVSTHAPPKPSRSASVT